MYWADAVRQSDAIVVLSGGAGPGDGIPVRHLAPILLHVAKVATNLHALQVTVS